MATRFVFRRITHFSPPSRQFRLCLSSTASLRNTPSPVLTSLRDDLKTAMRNKDPSRLAVLRSILADITNSSKTPNPITTDLQLHGLLKKRTAASQTAVAEFKAAGRDDLVRKEEKQIEVLEGYTQALQTDLVSEAEIRKSVQDIVEELKQTSEKLGIGDVIKRLIGPGGRLDGRMVEKKSAVSIVQEFLAVPK